MTTVPGAITSTPSADPGYGGAPPSTFKTEQGSGSSGSTMGGTQRPQLELKPTPDTGANPTTSMESPRLIMPSYRKTASLPVHHVRYDRPAAPATPAGLDVTGWRASQD